MPRAPIPAHSVTRSTLAALALLAAGCAGPAVAPPFAWDPAFASPGTTLTLQELSRTPTPEGTQVVYRIESRGFAEAEAPVLWWKRGEQFGRFAVALTTSGIVLVQPESDVFTIAEFVSGEPLDVALLDAGSGTRAQAKVIPFPIEAEGTGGTHASAEIQSVTGHAFLVTLSGFAAGETVRVESRLGEALVVLEPAASATGEVVVPLAFEAGATGEASLTATGGRGAVTLVHAVGAPALVVR
ncbi:MAG TPA: hypothetical protein VF530_21550 [Planctomycetota bacterium]